MPGKRSSFTLPVEPVSPPPKPVTAAPWIAPSATGLGGGAGNCPRVRRAYFDTVYHHSRARRQIEYKRYSALFKAEWQAAIRPAAPMGITRRAVTERAQGKAGRRRAKRISPPTNRRRFWKAVMAGLSVPRELFQEILGLIDSIHADPWSSGECRLEGPRYPWTDVEMRQCFRNT
jgi:hypothetical protein